MQTRRDFIKTAPCAACGLALAPAAVAADRVEARYYEKLAHRKIRCKLCPRECVIDDLERGYCGVRENQGGVYYTLVYGQVCSANIDPIEKKPLFHFLPRSGAFSVATVGCNVMCKFCQNWEISQSTPEQVQSIEMTPQKLARLAAARNCSSIAYTYSEPVIFTEYMYDCAQAGRQQNLRNVMISNGYIQADPMRDLCTVLDGVKIDLKAFTERFYRELVAGELRPVLDTLVLLRRQNMWTEIVYLVIPGENDDPDELKSLCKWIYNELGADIPVHFTRFHPQYRMKNLPPTPLQSLRQARQIGLDAGLLFVYTGNVPGDPGENTYCPSCGDMLIRRVGFAVVQNKIDAGSCPACNTKIAGVWT